MTALSDTALSVVSANFETRKFELIDDHTLRIRPTIGSLAFSLIFFLTGAGLIVFWAANTFWSLGESNSIFLLLGGILFAALGVASYRNSNQQLVINRETGAAFVRCWWPSAPLDTQSLFRHVLPAEIAAVQLVSKVVTRTSTNRIRSGRQYGRKTRSSYTEFQVNVCTSHDERFNAFITLRSEKAKKVGELMAQILQVRLVNHIDS